MTGLLWFDSDPQRTTAQKVTAAADCYAAKFGARPDTCHVHPAAGAAAVPGIRILAVANIPLHHLLIGRDEATP